MTATVTPIKGGGEVPLPTKVAQVMGELGTIDKRGEFKVGREVRYKYVQAADMYEAVRSKLADRGVAFQASFVEILSTREIPTSSGGKMHEVTVNVKCSLFDGQTGESMVANWAGSGMDSGDKAIYKAFTGAVKSWLMTTFLVPSDTDPDDAVAEKTQRQSSGKLPKKDADILASHVAAFLETGEPDAKDERRTILRLRLRQLGAKDVTDVIPAAVALSKDKATQLFEWLDEELVQAQKGAK